MAAWLSGERTCVCVVFLCVSAVCIHVCVCAAPRHSRVHHTSHHPVHASHHAPCGGCATPQRLGGWASLLLHMPAPFRVALLTKHPLAVLTVGATPSCCAYRGCHTLLLCLPWVPHPLGKHVRGASQPPQPTATQQPVKVLEALAGCCAVHLCADTRLSAAGLPPQRRCPCIISVRSLLPSTLRSLLLSTLTSTRPPARAASRSRPSTRPLPSSTSPRTARWRPWAARTWSCSCGALRPGSC